MKVEIYKVIRQTAGGFHSWVGSNVGIIRKSNNKIKIETNISKPKKTEWWQKILNFIKNLLTYFTG